MEITFDNLPKAVTDLTNELNEIKRLLLESINKPQLETDQLLTIEQVADFLSLSVPTIYGLVSRLEIPCMKKGKRLYFSKDEINLWLKTGRKRTVSEIKLEADNFLNDRKKGFIK